MCLVTKARRQTVLFRQVKAKNQKKYDDGGCTKEMSCVSNPETRDV